MDPNLIQILLSVAGAEAVTGALDKVKEGTGELGSELVKLGGIALSINSVLEGFKDALDYGDEMVKLSDRTGEMIQDLVVLQRAFDKTGVGADNVGTMVNRLQKALSGVNEMGKSTTEAFRALGTTQSQLEGRRFTDQIQILGEGFRNVKDPAQQAAISMQLFGKEGGQMLALFKDQHVLDDAAEDSGRLADRMQKSAKAFDDAGEKLEVIKIRLREMYVVALNQLLPALNAVGNVISGLNLSSVGAILGSGGAVAFASVLATTLVTKLDFAVMSWATGSGVGNVFAQSMVLPFTSKLAAFFTAALPPMIVAAVAGAIVVAIGQAMVDADDRLEKMRSGMSDESSSLRRGITGATTHEGAQKGKDAAQVALAAKEKELKQLEDSLFVNVDGQRVANPDPSSDLETRNRIEGLKRQIGEIKAMVSAPIHDSFIDRARVAEANKEYSKLVDNVEELNKERAKLRLSEMSPHERKAVLESAVEQREGALSESKPEGITDANWNARNIMLDTERLALKKEIAAAQKEIEEEDRKEVEEAKKKVDLDATLAKMKSDTAELIAKNAHNEDLEQEIKEKGMLITFEKQLADLGIADMSIAKDRVAAEDAAYLIAKAQRDEQRSDEAARLAMERGILELQNEETQLQGDYSKTEDERWALEQANLRKQIELHEKYLKQLRAERDLEKDPGAKATKDGRVHGEEGVVGGLRGRMNTSGPDPKSYGQQMTQMFTKLRGEYAMNARAFASSMSGAIHNVTGSLQSSIGGELSAIIMKTESWGEGMRNIGQAFLGSIVSAFTQMVAEYAVKKAAMFVIDTVIAAKSVALSAASAAESLIEWIPSAIAASISSYGVAAAIGAAAVIGIIASGGFSEGGYTGDGPVTGVAGPVHNREFVFSAPAVERIGKDNLAAIHEGTMPASVGSSRGGGGARGGRGDRPQQIVLVDTNRKASKLRRNSEMDTQIVSVMKANRGAILSK